ncbi:putative rstC protein [Vibrio parahaemolyticus NIHCB0757]|nr:putative rstC protein [Vibrio parahaemolyticus NIHCB0757]
MAVYLNSGSYTEEISEKIIHHLHDKIVDLQGMVNFIRIAPELQESKPQN